MQAVWPAQAENENFKAWAFRSLALAFGFSLLIGFCAHVYIPLPFTPVPITLQTFAVLLAAALLGSRLGTATMILYIVEGVAGLPVFAPGKGPFADGYLAGFVAAAWVVGLLAERRWDRNSLGMAAMMAIGSAIIYLFGAVWLAFFVGGIGHAVKLGILPFLPGDAAKAVLAAVLLPSGWKLLGTRRG
jgi:biotin transport system substrate-specific component